MLNEPNDFSDTLSQSVYDYTFKPLKQLLYSETHKTLDKEDEI